MKPGSHPRRGTAVMEFALLSPWLLFTFVGAFDWGFYATALISVENAARAAAYYAATDDTTAVNSARACQYALYQLRKMPNVGAGVTTCAAAPVTVTTQLVASGPDGAPAAQVDVTYRTVAVIPIPGVLTGQTEIHRTVRMRLRG